MSEPEGPQGERGATTAGRPEERGRSSREERTLSHQAPFYCPYCGEEDIRPFGERHGDWGCGACRRVWTLRYVGVARPGGGAAPGGTAPGGTADPERVVRT
jgi:hypothetical protein